MPGFKSCGVVLAVLFAPSWTVSETYRDPNLGFSIDVPDGWNTMSPSDLNVFQQFLDSIGDKSRYVAGFGESLPGNDFPPPYMLIQWIAYENSNIRGQATTQDIRETARPILDGGAVEYFQEQYRVNLSDAGIDARTSSDFLEPGLDLETKRLLYGMEIAGPVRRVYGAALIEFGREGMLQVIYYAADASVYTPDSLGLNTIQSLKLDESSKWQAELDRQGTAYGPPSPLARIIRTGVVGAAIGGLIGFGIWAIRKLLQG